MIRAAVVFALVLPACAENLRVLKGQVADLTETSLIIRDALLRPSLCRLTPDIERLAMNGSSAPPVLANGAYVEAIAAIDGANCSVRTLYIRPMRAPILTSARNANFLDNLFPRGNLIYTGTVQRLSERKLELRSRRGIRTEFTVRDDTTFTQEGRLVKAEDLAPQTVVQVRAGRTFAGELEVYQITWGEILPAH